MDSNTLVDGTHSWHRNQTLTANPFRLSLLLYALSTTALDQTYFAFSEPAPCSAFYETYSVPLCSAYHAQLFQSIRKTDTCDIFSSFDAILAQCS